MQQEVDFNSTFYDIYKCKGIITEIVLIKRA